MPQLGVLLQVGCLIALVAVLLVAAWQDLRTLRIGNRFSIALAAVFAIWSAVGILDGSFTFASLCLALACVAGLFGLGAAAFAAGMMGGGDVKLLAGVGLFAGPALVIDLLLVVALAGGLIGLAVTAGVPVGPAPAPGEATLGNRIRGRVPYGPAIAAGGLWVASRLALG